MLLAGGRTATARATAGAGATAGEWRFQCFLRDQDGDLLPLKERISNVFQVVRDSS